MKYFLWCVKKKDIDDNVCTVWSNPALMLAARWHCLQTNEQRVQKYGLPTVTISPTDPIKPDHLFHWGTISLLLELERQLFWDDRRAHQLDQRQSPWCLDRSVPVLHWEDRPATENGARSVETCCLHSLKVRQHDRRQTSQAACHDIYHKYF